MGVPRAWQDKEDRHLYEFERGACPFSQLPQREGNAEGVRLPSAAPVFVRFRVLQRIPSRFESQQQALARGVKRA